MNTVLLLIIAIPAVEIFLMIKIGQNIGALSTIGLIFLTAIIGMYFAKLEGLNTLRSGINNLYKNKVPIYEMMSGASIAFAALLLIIPGFVTDFFGFLLLIPFKIKKIINLFLKKKGSVTDKKDYIEGEILDGDKKDDL
ncbi:MAG: FxsA family protein [Pseudomonadota bacterium]|nr:FxsA family protein [Pseudomonadota bacterium]